jgi:5-formyltetrahydrofolate cyclo-ligase
MPDTQSDKARLRAALRRRRKTLSPVQQETAARAVADHIEQLPAWASAHRIAIYLAADGEIDTSALAARGRAAGKQLYLPVIRSDNSLAFARWERGATLHPNRYGIPEPPASCTRCGTGALDIIFMPLVGWDRSGGRLGMGGGFYDRSLAGSQGPVLVGLAHSCQEVDQLPLDPWDARLDYIATEAALHACRE